MPRFDWGSNHDVKPGEWSCWVCKGRFPHTEFFRDRSRPNGCCSRCKMCDLRRRQDRRNTIKQSVRNHPEGGVLTTSWVNKWKEKHG